MLGDNISTPGVGWPLSGEIDIMEQWRNNTTRTSAATHYRPDDAPHRYQYGEITGGPDYALAYHTYGVGWTPDQMSFYVDGELFLRVSRTGSTYCGGAAANPSRPDCTATTVTWPFNAPFFIILNNAVSDQDWSNANPWDGWATSTMAVDYVRVYALDGYGTVTPG
jgi:beta-glucanase (GH16 family)